MQYNTLQYNTILHDNLTFECHDTSTYRVQQLRVLDSPSQRLTYIRNRLRNALSEADRPHHRDHYPTLFDRRVGYFKSLNSVDLQ